MNSSKVDPFLIIILKFPVNLAVSGPIEIVRGMIVRGINPGKTFILIHLTFMPLPLSCAALP
jgi:hypothetical protein